MKTKLLFALLACLLASCQSTSSSNVSSLTSGYSSFGINVDSNATLVSQGEDCFVKIKEAIENTAKAESFIAEATAYSKVGAKEYFEQKTYKLSKDSFSGIYMASKTDGLGNVSYYQSGTEYYIDENGTKLKRAVLISEFFEYSASSYDFSWENVDSCGIFEAYQKVELKKDSFKDKAVSQATMVVVMEGSYAKEMQFDLLYSVSGVDCRIKNYLSYQSINETVKIDLPDLDSYSYWGGSNE